MSQPPPEPPAELHARLRDAFDAAAKRHERTGNRISLARLLLFGGGAVALASGFANGQRVAWVASALLLCGFFVAVLSHARTLQARSASLVRRDVHARHLLRLTGRFAQLPSTGEGLLPRDHEYALDIDLLGHASLFQRIDVTHTRPGERALAAFLAAPATHEVIRERQAAVRELAGDVTLRQELEASAAHDDEHGKPAKLDPSGIAALGAQPRLFAEHRLLRSVSLALPACTLVAYVLGAQGLTAAALWLLPAGAQVLLLVRLGRRISAVLDVFDARLPLVESYEELLLLVERQRFASPLLARLQQGLATDGAPPSAHLRRLRRLCGFAALRQNALFHVGINALTLWDLHVLHAVERFAREVGSRLPQWFAALGELEALSSLATLAHGDPDATFPELAPDGSAFEAVALGHPLLPPGTRVRNDVVVAGPGRALCVTGSNMAGKSTLLRAVGQNLVLALAGGPVIATSLRLPQVRLRASMRAEDSLESGASYFHAELQKLRHVIDGAEARPPVFFLLDELLRGTNARARYVGAKAVLAHLIGRGGFGLIATHDLELAAAEDELHLTNVHFTDVVVDGEMRFDYKLRPGIVRTSNALRLLAMAGIDVKESL